MATCTVSAKGWVVIPAAMRRKHRLVPGCKVDVVDYGGVLALVPRFRDPIRHARGLLSGGPSLTQALLEERRRESRREQSDA